MRSEMVLRESSVSLPTNAMRLLHPTSSSACWCTVGAERRASRPRNPPNQDSGWFRPGMRGRCRELGPHIGPSTFLARRHFKSAQNCDDKSGKQNVRASSIAFPFCWAFYPSTRPSPPPFRSISAFRLILFFLFHLMLMHVRLKCVERTPTIRRDCSASSHGGS